MANRRPRPIHPRLAQARRYEAAIRRTYLDPVFRRFTSQLAHVSALNQVWGALAAGLRATEALPRAGVPIEMIEHHLDRIRDYHRERVLSTFRSAFGVNIAPLLTEPQIAEFMAGKVAENVDLIKTIPRRSHDGLAAKIRNELVEAPFDQQRLMGMVQREYKVEGWNLRRITRDQTSKMIGQLTEIRHRQLGIERYIWETAGDERVRETHSQNSGLVFAWGAPPDTGPPGAEILCRCVATPLISSIDRTRLVEAVAEGAV